MRPFQIIGIDFLGPIKPPSTNGNTCIMVMTDYFSKWAEAIALPNQTAVVTADCLYTTIIQRHGPPEVIITDQGRNFTSKLFADLCHKFNIKHRMTTAYHPESNGETERFNRTLISMLRKVLQDGKHADWDKMLGDVMFAYRSSVHSSTLETPYYIIHGRDPNFAINNLLLNNETHNVTQSDYIGNLIDRLRFCFHKVRQETEQARKRQKAQYDKNAKTPSFKIGDAVLLDIRVVKPGDCRKFTSKFQGPFRVTRVFDNNTAEISDSSLKTQRTHVNRLKPFPASMIWGDEECPTFEPPTYDEHTLSHPPIETSSANPHISTFYPPYVENPQLLTPVIDPQPLNVNAEPFEQQPQDVEPLDPQPIAAPTIPELPTVENDLPLPRPTSSALPANQRVLRPREKCQPPARLVYNEKGKPESQRI